MDADETEAAFSVEDMFKGVEEPLGIDPGNVEKLAASALVALDTSALLVPYTAGSKSLKEIARILTKLAEAKRLVVPKHVVREFVRQRPEHLANAHKAIADRASRVASALSVKSFPFLSEDDDFKEVLECEEQLRTISKKHREACKRVGHTLIDSGWSDPVTSAYRPIFGAAVSANPTLNREELAADLARRDRLKIPPGYKDGTKQTNAAGDLIVWHALLAAAEGAQCDLLFVSSDKKADWFVRSGGAGIWPRPELVAEFSSRTGGRAFAIADLGELLRALDADADVVEEVERAESKAPAMTAAIEGAWAESTVRDWLKGVYDLTEAVSDHAGGVGPCDFVLSSLDGARVAVGVRWLRKGADLGVVSESAFLLDEAREAVGARSAVLCIVQPSLALARVTNRNLKFATAVPNNVTIHVGVLRDGRFVEVVSDGV